MSDDRQSTALSSARSSQVAIAADAALPNAAAFAPPKRPAGYRMATAPTLT